MYKKNLLGLDYNEIHNQLSDIENIQNYNIKQIYQWIYKNMFMILIKCQICH